LFEWLLFGILGFRATLLDQGAFFQKGIRVAFTKTPKLKAVLHRPVFTKEALIYSIENK
jgi:hypothetical protein